MNSSAYSRNREPCDLECCTTAITFRKSNSIQFEILFGNYEKSSSKRVEDNEEITITKCIFKPGEIFGFSYQTLGRESKSMHHSFVLQACAPGSVGNVIPGISPGAKILLETQSSPASLRLKKILTEFTSNGINPSLISIRHFERLNRLLDIKTCVNYFVNEVIFEYSLS